MSTRTSKSPLQLNSDDERQVVISPENEDRFVLSCKETIQAVQSGLGDIAFHAELKELIKHLKGWVESRAANLHSCYLASRDGELVVFTVPKSSQYDRDLADELTALDVTLANKFQYWRCQVVQVPGETPTGLASFLDQDKALLLYGPNFQTPATPREVAP